VALCRDAACCVRVARQQRLTPPGSLLHSRVPQVLLNKTPFFLERGHRYGLIGQNGVGKTTLLTRIAAGDINNFPKDVSCYYIQHEILAEEGTSVSTFMLGQVRLRPRAALERVPGCGAQTAHNGAACMHAPSCTGAGRLQPRAHHGRAGRRGLLRGAQGGRGERAVWRLAHEAGHRAQHAVGRR
jgi:hypothetical protein